MGRTIHIIGNGDNASRYKPAKGIKQIGRAHV